MTDTVIGFDLDDSLITARKVAREFGQSYPGVEADDVFGELSLKLVEKGPAWFDNAVAHDRQEDFPKLVTKALRNEAATFCRSERGQTLSSSATYYYQPVVVKSLLDGFFGPKEEWENVPTPPDAESELGHVGVEMLSDISQQWDSLPHATRVILAATHLTKGQGKPDWNEIGEILEKTPETARKEYGRAVDELTKRLNRWWATKVADYEGPGSRTVNPTVIFED